MAGNLKLKTEHAPPVPKPRSSSRAEKLVLRALERIKEGLLVIEFSDGRELTFGTPGCRLTARVRIHRKEFFGRVLQGGVFALGEMYLEGWWEIQHNTLLNLHAIILRNDLFPAVKTGPLSKVAQVFRQLRSVPLRRVADERDPECDYELTNEFYSLMLDKSMAYSCGYQLRSTDTLDQMQEQKYELICSKLGISHGGRLLDLGCGWGGMLMHVAHRYRHLHALGVTLSDSRRVYAQQRIVDAGFSHRIAVDVSDYREVKGMYNYVVSIGAFEHVRQENYAEFMRRIAEFLAPGGIGLVQTIACTDSQKEASARKHIYPGSRLPRLDEIIESLGNAKLLVSHIESLKAHYGDTLRKWRDNLNRNESQLRLLDRRFDERFLRMWNYYLQGAEAGFRYGDLQVYQILFCKAKQWPFPYRFEHSAA